MGYPSRPIPELQRSDLRPFLPAIRHAARLAGEEAERMEDRFELRELEVLGRTQEELRQLRQLIQKGERR